MSDVVKTSNIQNHIFTIQGVQVMLDKDLAKIYGVELKRLNEQVKRNIDRFPKRFRFQLTEVENQGLTANNVSYKAQEATSVKSDSVLGSQIATLKKMDKRGKHSKYLPYVFTEQGISMLSSVLHSETAINVSIKIMDAFVEMRRFIADNAAIFHRLDSIDRKQIETDSKVEQIFKAIEDKTIKPKQGIFFDGQIFDAYAFVCDIIKQAKKSIVLIDNYVDETVLTLLSKRNKKVKATIYTKPSQQLNLDLKKHNQQYSEIAIKKLTRSHDRFIIIDEKTVYHFGASLKDLGRKWFAFSKMEQDATEILSKLEKFE
jgi:hypothetical protein